MSRSGRTMNDCEWRTGFGRCLASAALLLTLTLTLTSTAAADAADAASPASTATATTAAAGDPGPAEASAEPAAAAVTGRLEVTADLPRDASVATKLPLSLAWTPGSVGVVTAPLWSEQDGRTASDALRNVSGVNVQTQSGTTDFFLIRGFDSVSSGLVLSNGVAEPEASFYHLYNLDRVETLKGPAGFLYGGNSLAGAVSLVRKRPQETLGTSLELRGGSFGSLGTSFDWNAGQLGSATGAPRLRLNGFYSESDGYREQTASSSWAVNPTFAWQLAPGTALDIDLEWVDNEASPDSGLPLVFGSLPELPRERSYQSPFDRSEQGLGRFRADFSHELSSTISLRAKTYYTSLDWRSDGTLFVGAFPTGFGNTVLARTLVLLDDRQEFFGQQLEGIMRFATGSVEHQLLVGLELGEQRDDFTFDVALLPIIDVFDPVETASEPLFVIPGVGGAGDARSRIIAPYVLDRIFLTERFELVLGGRLDVIDYRDAVSGQESDDQHFSPILGAVWAPAESWSLYANLSEGFAPPSTLVQTDREFEQSRGVEAGMRKSFAAGKWNLTLAGFELERDNIGIPDDNGFTQQAGDQRSRGVELELAAAPAPGWNAFFSYAYTDAELVRFAERIQISQSPPLFLTLDRSGNAPPFAPEHLANLWVSKRFAGGFGVAGGARYIGEQYIAEDNVYAIADAVTLDASVSYVFPRRAGLEWLARLNLRNLTDEETFKRGFGSSSVIPDDERSVTGTLEVRF